MKYVNIIPFLNISIFKADNPDIDFNTKYNEFFDGDKTQIYVSLTSISELKKCLIYNLETIKEGSWKEDYVIIDEIDSIIDPCKSEVNLVNELYSNGNINKYILYKWIEKRIETSSKSKIECKIIKEENKNDNLDEECLDTHINNLYE
jgi:hypothetical protein